MSKSLGNGIDPLDVIDKFGVDALRYFLMSNTAPGQDTRYIEEKVIASSNYLNKIWNSARYVLSILGDDFKPAKIDVKTLTALELHLLHKHDKTIASVTRNMDKYQFSMALKNLYRFVYDDFCGHFLEMSKVSMQLESSTRKENTKQVLYRVLKDIIIMMAPYTPFIAEELYLSLPNHQASVILEKFPEVYKTKVLRQDEVAVEELYQAIQDIRNYKVEKDLAPNHPLNIKIRANKEPFADFSKYLARFAFAKQIVINDEIEVQESDISFFYSCFDVVIEETINREEALKKLNIEKEKIVFEINRSKGMLANEKFIAKAPKDKIDLEKEKYQKNNDLLAIILKKIDKLK